MKEFDDLMKEIHGNGWYINRLLYYLVLPVLFLMPFLFLHQIFVLHIPEHNCKPPPELEPETLGMNLSTWKMTFLPIEMAADYTMKPSQCKMYNVSQDDISGFMDGSLPGDQAKTWPTMPCPNGYIYSQLDFVDTVVTDNDWVCDLNTRPTDLYTYGTVGLIIGTFIFSAFADWKGRKPAFYVCAVVVIVFQFIKIWLAHNYSAYVAAKIIAFTAMMPLFQSPMNISTEMLPASRRGYVIGLVCVFWALGSMLLPLVGWLIGRWRWIVGVSVLPMLFVFSMFKVMPESPRWLVTTGRVEEAERIIRKACKVNKSRVPNDLSDRLNVISRKTAELNKNTYGYLTLFTSFTMARRTIAICITQTASSFVYYQLVINIHNMGGNFFLNMFLMSLVEGPGSMIGVIIADKLGRRWTQVFLLLINSICFFIIMWLVQDPSLFVAVNVLCMIIKFNISATFGLGYVQAMEIFPTCVRQSGIGIATFVATMISIGGPYVIYLAFTDLKLPYAVMFLVCLIGSIAASTLPETAGKSLPETMPDAEAFGRDEKFFSWYMPFRNKMSDGEKPDKTVNVNVADEEEMKSLKNPDIQD